MFLILLSLSIRSERSIHFEYSIRFETEFRFRTKYYVAEFNEPKSKVQVLVTSLRVGATHYNLQGGCHHILCLDVAHEARALPNTGHLLQGSPSIVATPRNYLT
jgi:hypothetical protein